MFGIYDPDSPPPISQAAEAIVEATVRLYNQAVIIKKLETS